MSVSVLNGEILKMEAPACILTDDILERHVADHIPNGQAISDVHVDSPVLAMDYPCDSTNMLVRGLLASAAQMDRICSTLRHSTEHLRVGNESHFRPLFSSAIDELAMFLKFLAFGRSQVGDKGNVLDHFYAQIKEQVEQMFQAYQRRDLVLLADMIEFELTPLFEGWQGVRNALLKSLAPHACNA